MSLLSKIRHIHEYGFLITIKLPHYQMNDILTNPNSIKESLSFDLKG